MFWAKRRESVLSFRFVGVAFWTLALLREDAFQIDLAMDRRAILMARKDSGLSEVWVALWCKWCWVSVLRSDGLEKYMFPTVHSVLHVGVIRILVWGLLVFCLSLSRCCLVARVRVVNPQWVLRQREFFLEFYCAGHLWLKKKSFFHLGRFIKNRLPVGLW